MVPSLSATRRPLAWGTLALVALAAGVSCRKDATAGAPGQDPPALPVKIEVAHATPIDEVSEYVATVKSRDSAVIMPEVEGQITQVLVRSGDRVAAGTPLVQIDPARQRASVKSQQDTLAARQASLDLATQEHERAKALHAEGILSRQALDQARAALDAAQAELGALGAQLDEEQVELRYHRVTAPTDGVVGDIPVRVGDRVTVSTILTTIDRSSDLEVYVSVPVERAPDLRPGLLLQILDTAGAVAAETRVGFVSPRVDEGTQTVLAKAPLPSGGRGLRQAQLVRARIVWGTRESLVVPVLAVSRLGGQYFAFVAEENEGALVARQKPVRLGEIVGNDYVVLDGLAAGDRVIVSGTQMLADGATVQPQG